MGPLQSSLGSRRRAFRHPHTRRVVCSPAGRLPAPSADRSSRATSPRAAFGGLGGAGPLLQRRPWPSWGGLAEQVGRGIRLHLLGVYDCAVSACSVSPHSCPHSSTLGLTQALARRQAWATMPTRARAPTTTHQVVTRGPEGNSHLPRSGLALPSTGPGPSGHCCLEPTGKLFILSPHLPRWAGFPPCPVTAGIGKVLCGRGLGGLVKHSHCSLGTRELQGWPAARPNSGEEGREESGSYWPSPR